MKEKPSNYNVYDDGKLPKVPEHIEVWFEKELEATLKLQALLKRKTTDKK